MKQILIVAALLAAGSAAGAEDLDSFNLGDIIGSEKACGFKLDQSAIVRWIETSAPDGDASFADHMNGAAGLMGREIAEFTETQKAAHCAQTMRVAKALGFLE